MSSNRASLRTAYNSWGAAALTRPMSPRFSRAISGKLPSELYGASEAANDALRW